MQRFKAIAIPGAVVMAVVSLVAWAARDPVLDAPEVSVSLESADVVRAGVRAVDEFLEGRWRTYDLAPAAPANDLIIMRRLSLVLHGTIPSLEEVRRFEADDRPERLDRHVQRLLADTRFGDYFAERLARNLVGTDGGPFIIYRRDQFTGWLAQQLMADRPYDELAREIIASRGLWTGTPATNFVTNAVNEGQLDESRIAGRTVRAFLGQRIDCAQCHDHPFEPWKQHQFEGLAAFYRQTKTSIVGIEDVESRLFDLDTNFAAGLDAGKMSDDLLRQFDEHNQELRRFVHVEVLRSGDVWLLRDATRQPEADGTAADRVEEAVPDASALELRFVIFRDRDVLHVADAEGEFVIEHPLKGKKRVVMPEAPFHPEWLPGDENRTRRERLAAWITHPENRRFDRAFANRIWGLLFGRPWHEPVDDVPDPNPAETDLLDLLGTEFRSHNYSVKHLIRTIAASRAFQIGSVHPTEDDDAFRTLAEEWAVFPLVRLRPEQVIGSMVQAGYVRTIDLNSHLFVRMYRFFNERDFVNEYGDPGDAELDQRGGTIPQALLRMNGQFTRELVKTSPFSAAGRIMALSGSNEQLIENCFLVCLSRRPTAGERTHFLKQLDDAPELQRDEITQDLYWALFNSPEFSWAH